MGNTRRLFGLALGAWLATFVAVSCGGSSGRNGANPERGSPDGGSGGSGEETGGAPEGGALNPASAGATDGGAPQQLGGAGGEAGALGGGGMGGDGGAPMAPYVATDCLDEPIELDDELVRFCVMAASCSGGQRNIAYCLSAVGQDMWMRFDHPPFTAKTPRIERLKLKGCTKLESCDDLLECAGFRAPQRECEASQAARCEGQLAINCTGDPADSHPPGVTDCNRMTGLPDSCRVVGSGNAARALCIVDDACSGGASCQGNMLRRCVDGLSEGIDCSRFGERCEQPSAGEARCAPPLPQQTCDKPGTPFCNGDKPAYCNPDGLLYEGGECSKTGGLTCGEASGQEDVQVGCFTPHCASTEDTDWGCEGDDFRFAADLWKLRVHCPAYGFATCRNDVCAN